MRHPALWRHSTGTRGMALWLIVAQVTLFGAAGLTHLHATFTGATDVAARSASRSATFQPGRLTAPGVAHRHGPSHCAICHAARSTVVSLVAVPDLPAVAAPEEAKATFLPSRLRVASTSPCSTRAPPSSAS